MATTTEIKKKRKATRFGKRNGYVTKSQLLPKRLGNCWAGLAKKPPKLGPKTEPILQTRGMREKACGWSSFHGTISATIVLIIPTSWCVSELEHEDQEIAGA